MPKRTFAKRNFQGGINQLMDTTKIAENQYPLLINGRSHFDKVRPVPKSILIQDSRWTKLQGVYATDVLIIVFADGKAYWRDLSNTTTSAFTQVQDFAMDSTVDFIYAQLVPAASLTSIRKAKEASDSSAGLTYVNSGQSYPQALVVQDGINQPWLIFGNGSAREAQNYAQWTMDNREYVPIGKQMLYSGGRLYIISSDGRSILRSVTGRPCDFVVVVDKNGDKLPDPSQGDANAVSYQVDYNPIVAIHPVNLQDGSFFVSTGYTSYLVTPNRSVTVFDEPYFSASWLFPTGPRNNFSFVDVVGDAVFVTSKGIRNFNAVMSTKFEGKNLPFSRLISKLFDGVTQTYTAGIIYDEEYALFSCQTIYGNSIIAYNAINQVFESVDIISGVSGLFKQFAMARAGGSNRLFGITEHNELVELYAESLLKESCKLYAGDWISPDNLCAEQKPIKGKVIFDSIRESGTVYATLYVDGNPHTRLPSTVEVSDLTSLPITPPNAPRDIADVNVQYQDSPTGWKLGLWIEWDFDAEVVGVVLDTNEDEFTNPLPAQANDLDYYSNGDCTITSFSPLSGPINTLIHVYGSGMLSVAKVWIGDYEVTQFARLSDNELQIKASNPQSGFIKVQTLSGNFVLTQAQFVCIL